MKMEWNVSTTKPYVLKLTFHGLSSKQIAELIDMFREEEGLEVLPEFIKSEHFQLKENDL